MEKRTLEDKKSELRNKDRELQDLEEKHQVEIKVYKQRVKHLLYEHQNEATHLKTGVCLCVHAMYTRASGVWSVCLNSTALSDGQVSLKMSQDQHRDSETELQKDERALKLELKEMELSHEDYVKSLKSVCRDCAARQQTHHPADMQPTSFTGSRSKCDHAETRV